MSSPEHQPHPDAPIRRPTGAIPAHWTVPAEVSASAVDKLPKAKAAPRRSVPRGPIFAAVVVVVAAAVGGAIASGVISLPEALLGRQEAAPVVNEPTVVKRAQGGGEATVGEGGGEGAAEGGLTPEPILHPTDNPALVTPKDPKEQAAPEPEAAPAEPEPQVVLDELPVRRKVKRMIVQAEKLVRKGRYRSAERVLLKARRLDPSYPAVYRTLGIARARLGEFEGARKAYERYLELAPTAPDAADVRRILGQ